VTMVIEEIITLEGIDLDNTPPCEVVEFPSPWGWRFCGKPSAYRILSACPSCGTHRLFACQGCQDQLLQGTGQCTRCWKSRGIDGYC
jgi:hypothetical protein